MPEPKPEAPLSGESSLQETVTERGEGEEEDEDEDEDFALSSSEFEEDEEEEDEDDDEDEADEDVDEAQSAEGSEANGEREETGKRARKGVEGGGASEATQRREENRGDGVVEEGGVARRVFSWSESDMRSVVSASNNTVRPCEQMGEQAKRKDADTNKNSANLSTPKECRIQPATVKIYALSRTVYNLNQVVDFLFLTSHTC
jgi:hypothetical protein